jgi:hypothetical protein
MPGLAYGLATRARRPRPSEKITSRVVSGPSPLGVPHCAWPRRGGAGSARPGGWAWAPHRDFLILAASPQLPMRPQAVATSPVACTSLAFRGDSCVPRRKPPLALSRGLPRQGRLPSALRETVARDRGWGGAFGTRAFALPRVSRSLDRPFKNREARYGSSREPRFRT